MHTMVKLINRSNRSIMYSRGIASPGATFEVLETEANIIKKLYNDVTEPETTIENIQLESKLSEANKEIKSLKANLEKESKLNEELEQTVDYYKDKLSSLEKELEASNNKLNELLNSGDGDY